MSKILFACDLDNTLIHSRKHKREGDICIEWINGEEQGYISPQVIRELQHVRQAVEFVPVTTRSIAQYQRIVWPQGCRPHRALTTHGAHLLDNSSINPVWEIRSKEITAPTIASLQSLVNTLEETGLFLRCRLVDQTYAFVYCKNDDESMNTAMTIPLPDGVYRIRSGKKVYFIPNGIDKGSSVARLKADKNYTMVICAGDSEMDVPMLITGDIAFAPNTLREALPRSGHIHVCNTESFASEMLAGITHILHSGMYCDDRCT